MKKTTKEQETDRREEEGLLKGYEIFATRLRAWLIAFGVGGPALIITNEHLYTELTNEIGQLITSYFMFGLAFQVAFAVLNKWAQWKLWIHVSKENEGEESAEGPLYKLANFTSEHYVFDWIADIGAIIFYFLALRGLLSVVVSVPAY